MSNYTHCNKRKPPCIGGMELASLSCNRVFISAESVGRGWCKIEIATQWYQFHTIDKCGFLFMPWINDQCIFVRYTKLVNKIGTAVAKVITFSITKTYCNIHSVWHAAPPHPDQKLRAIFHVQNWNGFPVISMRRSVQSKQVVCGRRPVLCQRWISSQIWYIMLNWQHLLDGMISKHHQDLFATPAFPSRGPLARCW